jgi:ferredoxin
LNRSDGVARAVSPVSRDLVAELVHAIDSCPTGAIRMH